MDYITEAAHTADQTADLWLAAADVRSEWAIDEDHDYVTNTGRCWRMPVWAMIAEAWCMNGSHDAGAEDLNGNWCAFYDVTPAMRAAFHGLADCTAICVWSTTDGFAQSCATAAFTAGAWAEAVAAEAGEHQED